MSDARMRIANQTFAQLAAKPEAIKLAADQLAASIAEARRADGDGTVMAQGLAEAVRRQTFCIEALLIGVRAEARTIIHLAGAPAARTS